MTRYGQAEANNTGTRYEHSGWSVSENAASAGSLRGMNDEWVWEPTDVEANRVPRRRALVPSMGVQLSKNAPAQKGSPCLLALSPTRGLNQLAIRLLGAPHLL